MLRTPTLSPKIFGHSINLFHPNLDPKKIIQYADETSRRPTLSYYRKASFSICISDDYLTNGERLRRFVTSASHDPIASHVRWRHVFAADELPKIIADKSLLVSAAEIYAPQYKYFEAAKDAGYSDMDALMFGDMQTWLVDCGLMMWDKAGMSASAEIRVPLIDNDLVDFITRIPQEIRAPNPGSKSFMRGIFAHRLPDYVLNQPKHGFQIPIASWLRSDLGATFRELTAELPVELIQRKAVDSLWKRFEERRQDNSLKIWTLGCLSGWASAQNVKLC